MFTKDELTQIEGTLYEPAARRKALTLRQVISVNRSALAFAMAIGYKTLEGKGEARVRKAGSKSKDYKYVGEEASTATQPTYDVDSAISWNKDEVEEARAAAMLGKGPTIPIDQFRIRTAQRVVDEKIDMIGFVGSPDGEVKGLLNYIHGKRKIQTVEAGKPFGEKGMTPYKMLDRILELTSIARHDDDYDPKVLVVPPRIGDMFARPFSEQNTQSVLQWMQTQGGMPGKIIRSKAMTKEYNGLGSDCIMVLDNDPAIVELSLLRDLEMSAPRQTDFYDWEMLVRSKTGGIILREPEAVAVMPGV